MDFGNADARGALRTAQSGGAGESSLPDRRAIESVRHAARNFRGGIANHRNVAAYRLRALTWALTGKALPSRGSWELPLQKGKLISIDGNGDPPEFDSLAGGVS